MTEVLRNDGIRYWGHAPIYRLRTKYPPFPSVKYAGFMIRPFKYIISIFI